MDYWLKYYTEWNYQVCNLFILRYIDGYGYYAKYSLYNIYIRILGEFEIE